MVSIELCSECKGKGSYLVHNAYDPENKEEVICEYCDGCGVINDDAFILGPEKIIHKHPKQSELN